MATFVVAVTPPDYIFCYRCYGNFRMDGARLSCSKASWKKYEPYKRRQYSRMCSVCMCAQFVPNIRGQYANIGSLLCTNACDAHKVSLWRCRLWQRRACTFQRTSKRCAMLWSATWVRTAQRSYMCMWAGDYIAWNDIKYTKAAQNNDIIRLAACTALFDPIFCSDGIKMSCMHTKIKAKVEISWSDCIQVKANSLPASIK